MYNNQNDFNESMLHESNAWPNVYPDVFSWTPSPPFSLITISSNVITPVIPGFLVLRPLQFAFGMQEQEREHASSRWSIQVFPDRGRNRHPIAKSFPKQHQVVCPFSYLTLLGLQNLHVADCACAPLAQEPTVFSPAKQLCGLKLGGFWPFFCSSH
jgi:hypothetical protein